MRTVPPQLVGLLGAVVGATALGIAVLYAGTWFVWAYGYSAMGRLAFVTPLVVAILVQGAVELLALRRRRVSAGAVITWQLCSLVVLLVVGGVLTEMIHCSFDRGTCMNL